MKDFNDLIIRSDDCLEEVLSWLNDSMNFINEAFTVEDTSQQPDANGRYPEIIPDENIRDMIAKTEKKKKAIESLVGEIRGLWKSQLNQCIECNSQEDRI